MRPLWSQILVLTSLFVFAVNTPSLSVLHEKRRSSSDLEVSGALAGLPPEATRYISRDELLAMPQASFTVTDDMNFTGPTKIGGVKLEDLAMRFGASPAANLVVAICDDGYRAIYPHNYLAAHHPVLVLEVNGQGPAGWPKAAEDSGSRMGPYMISNPRFTPSFRILSHTDEAQIPWGVVRIEFREEKLVLGAIEPRGVRAQDRRVRDGFRIAQQNCFRCHNTGSEGGEQESETHGRLSAHLRRRRPGNSPPIFAIHMQKILGRRCPEIPHTMTRP